MVIRGDDAGGSYVGALAIGLSEGTSGKSVRAGQVEGCGYVRVLTLPSRGRLAARVLK